ncbi:MAG TPA: mandelate racemase/muconate lactonizing enzyme family protein [Stellaceae bacterium]|jgi:L-alanine-DL-glutamate epimerase-like enolase superfamily enzyme|nr:mandelate racemase/muconate lactonizing enzyme family protein [Stellaceae bacterium]
MKIVKIEDLHCDAGWRVNSFLKVTTDEGIIGWSEYMEGYGAQGLTGVIRKLGERLIGQDPRPVERISAQLYAVTIQASGGVNAQAIAAIENALVDIKAKALGVPVYEMLGGPFRDRLQVYWSHCGSYRARHADRIKEWAGVEPIRSLDDIVRLGAEVKSKGFKGLKTNIIRFDGDRPYMYHPGTGNPPGFPELNIDKKIVDAAYAQLAAFREGAGPEVGLHLDTNFNYKIDGYIKLARALEPLDLVWLEIDLYDPAGLALIRRSARTPISSCESLYGRRQFRPYFEQQSVDYAIIDVAWNGILESVKIAAMADAYEVNVAPHNFNGHLGSLISAHFCAAVPNFKVMEIDIDDVLWKDDIVTRPPVIDNGDLLLPTGPGWGADVNEEFVRAHPPNR